MQEHEIVDRLVRLERENRRWRRAAGFLGVTLCATFAIGFASPTRDVVEAERFVLRGADGTEHGSLGLDEQGSPTLLMRKGKSYAVLTLSAPGLLVRGPDGKRGAFLGIDTKGATLLELSSDKLQQGVKLAVDAEGSSGVYLRDASGFSRTTMEALATGDSIFTVRGEKSALRGTFGLDANGNASTLLLDSIGRRRIGMVVQTDGTPLLSMEDETTRARANLTMKFDGSPRLELLREDGAPSFTAP